MPTDCRVREFINSACKSNVQGVPPTDDTDVISLPQGPFARHACTSLPLKLLGGMLRHSRHNNKTGGTCSKKIAKNSFYKISTKNLNRCLGNRCPSKVIKSHNFHAIRKKDIGKVPTPSTVSPPIHKRTVKNAIVLSSFTFTTKENR